ncbi:hypothetical protein ACV3RR_03800 [Clostridium perfringens]|uniref:hypothetical protein n=1 Tax=Clostridium perfringens TaxID=1502 RepID=UPI0039E995C5
MRTIRTNSNKEYKLLFDWKDFGICCNEDLVNKTAFFEVYPNNPNTYLRVEGKSLSEAEIKAWEQYQKILNCPKHEFERRNYKNGAGFCKYCGLFNSNAFEPVTKCHICGRKTNYSYDKDNNYYCKAHADNIPVEQMNKWKREYYLICKAKSIYDKKSLNNAIVYIKNEIKPYYMNSCIDDFIGVISRLYNDLSNNLNKENISDEYKITYEECDFTIKNIIFNRHKFKSYITIKISKEQEYIVLLFDEYKDMSLDDNVVEYKETGRIIYLVPLIQDDIFNKFNLIRR